MTPRFNVPYNAHGPQVKKHWTEEAEDDALFSKMVMEAAQAQINQAPAVGPAPGAPAAAAGAPGAGGAAGGGGTPPQAFFNTNLASFNFSAVTETGAAPFTAQFTSDGDDSIKQFTNHSWSFGEGGSGSFEVSPSYVYNLTGTYPISLTVTAMYNAESTSSTKLAYISASVPVIIGSFTADLVTGSAPLAVTFSAVVTGYGSGVIYNWILGSGSLTSADTSPTMSYGSGSYTVELRVSSSQWSNATSSIRPLYISCAD